MSRELVDLFTDAYNRRDFDVIAGLLHQEVEVRGYDGRLNRGPEAALQSFRDWCQQWKAFTGETEEYHDLGGGRALVISRFRGKGEASGLQVDMQAGEIWRFREGKIAGIAGFRRVEEARAAARSPE